MSTSNHDRMGEMQLRTGRSARRRWVSMGLAATTLVAYTLVNLAPTAASASPTTVLYGWGDGQFGEIGNGSTSSPLVPVQVSLPFGVQPTAASAGEYHSMAIGSDGNLYTWGYNADGELGNGTTNNSSTPAVITLAPGITATAISAGFEHSAAVGSNGKVYTWGYNGFGQLGDGTTTNSLTPVVANLPAGVTATAVATGANDTIALTSTGAVYSWGDGTNGALGQGPAPTTSTPKVVVFPGSITITAIAYGSAGGYAIGSDGHLYSWGHNNLGQIGDGTATNRRTPVLVTLAAGVSPTAISGGGDHGMALGSDGKVYDWGYNGNGQLGNG